MSQLNNIPKFGIPLKIGESTSKDWYFFWNGLYTGLSPALPISITVGTSPFTYSPQVKGTVIVQGGTVSSVQFSRDGITFYDFGTVAGPFPLNAADRIVITYSIAPTMTFIPT